MKQLKILATVLSVLSLALCAWSFYQLSLDETDKIQASLNAIYFIALFVALFSFRISLGYSSKIPVVISLLSLAIMAVATYTWFSPNQLLEVGKITLGLIPVLIGLTIRLILKGTSKLSKVLEMSVLSVAILIALFVFIGVHATTLYMIALFGMIFATIAVAIHFIFVKH